MDDIIKPTSDVGFISYQLAPAALGVKLLRQANFDLDFADREITGIWVNIPFQGLQDELSFSILVDHLLRK